MEMMVGVDRTVVGFIEDGAANKLGSGLAPLKQGADPIVYKLVKFEFDGRMVPATDDVLIEVDNFLELEKNDMLPMPDVMETLEHVSNKDITFENPLLEKHEGMSQIKLVEDEEEGIRVQAEHSLPTSTSSSKDRLVKVAGSIMEESSSNHHDGLTKSGSTESQPNFSLIKGEINLDNLSVRELHETFKATFGRETSVKDKMWLKRRIAMGLTNSCDVSVASFVINDGKFLKKKEELNENISCEDSVTGEISKAGVDGPVNFFAHPNLSEDMVNDTELKNSFSESGCKSDDNVESRGAKRVRKPTKRYIEELCDKEKDNVARSMPSSKRFEKDIAPVKAILRPASGVHSFDFITRPDNIGGSGVQVPYVSRIRRCRPRKSITELTKFHASEGTLIRKGDENSVAVIKSEPDDCISVEEEGKSIPFEEPIASEVKREKQSLSITSHISQASEPNCVDSENNSPLDNTPGNNSDDHVATVPTANGGMRRKHHRAWSLTEVMKLVDGVAKFGAGRWSEIKRLSFSSYSHRTPVDLKDKWRNLLKASYANSHADKGANPRKNTPVLIPATILVRVRELAELNGQAPQVPKGCNNHNNGSNVNENRSEH
ncbi:uncharacterized protein LOC130813745 [Amaranthus tricolor]|uniref:uncharacterized protein LOC130813745 n=1 Tax=Amaranthus tricolor TaxID=29722 RepID=UPI002585870C|nr:uncharacterized protein LOC130813745 [Amaranthus tricolor]XP_057535587.1 uncharacterized protein LOC130813745 [Amaranthus tricolor]XP_057535588.1 uncharacterized protein LOC130813745 [Amaranthus tricolor]